MKERLDRISDTKKKTLLSFYPQPPQPVVAFLQNQWFKNPESARKMFARQPDLREVLIRKTLFMGSVTGRNLARFFSQATCDKIIWEETSKNIAGFSAGCFPADFDHIHSVLNKWSPKVVLAFGRVASDALEYIMLSERPPWRIVVGPHPASRGSDLFVELRLMNDKLHSLL